MALLVLILMNAKPTTVAALLWPFALTLLVDLLAPARLDSYVNYYLVIIAKVWRRYLLR